MYIVLQQNIYNKNSNAGSEWIFFFKRQKAREKIKQEKRPIDCGVIRCI